jgi:choline dehydrogenase-like flavoprotein
MNSLPSTPASPERRCKEAMVRSAAVSAKPSFAVIGAGIGGLAVAAFLARQGAKVAIYEQAKQFLWIGAGIQMSPDARRLLRVRREPPLRKLAFGRPGGPASGNRHQFSRSSRM